MAKPPKLIMMQVTCKRELDDGTICGHTWVAKREDCGGGTRCPRCLGWRLTAVPIKVELTPDTKLVEGPPPTTTRTTLIHRDLSGKLVGVEEVDEKTVAPEPEDATPEE